MDDQWSKFSERGAVVFWYAAVAWGFVTIAASGGCGLTEPDSAVSGESPTALAGLVRQIIQGQADRIVAATPLSDGEWESLRGLAGLKELVLQAGRADDTRAEIIASLPDIERLVLRESPLSDKGFRSLAACLMLRDLNVPQAACTAAGVEALAGLPHLRSLRLGGVRQGGRELCEAIVRLPHLRTLHLIDIPIGDDGLAVLAGRPDLWNLYLDGAGASDAAWQRYFAACPKVHVHVDQAHHDRDPGRTHE